MKTTNVYKVALISGAMAASGFAFAAFTGGIAPSAPHIAPPAPQTTIEQKNTDVETNDDAVTQNKNHASIDEKDATGTVSDENQKETKDDVVKLPTGAISENVAKKSVLYKNPKAQIVGIETEDENGTVVYNVSLKDGTDVKIDAVKGTILSTDKRGDEGKVDTDKETNDDASKTASDGESETND